MLLENSKKIDPNTRNKEDNSTTLGRLLYHVLLPFYTENNYHPKLYLTILYRYNEAARIQNAAKCVSMNLK